jgi:CheY-like chemotaxis protein
VSRVLVVDDEPQIRRALAINLRARGYQVDLAATGEEALKVAADQPLDVIVLDLGLPGISGLEVIQGLRGWTRIPIIVLSVREREADKVAALDAGADDYVTKPFGINELLARLRAAVRRASLTEQDAPVIQTPDFRVDLAAKQVSRGGREVRLTPTSGSWSRSWSATPAGWSASGSCCKRSGGPSIRRRPTTCACSSPRSAANWNPIPRTPATSSPNPAWATDSNPRTNPGRPTNHGHPTAPNALPPSCRLLGSTGSALSRRELAAPSSTAVRLMTSALLVDRAVL